MERNDSISRIDQGDIPRKYKNRILIGLHGLGLVTRPEYIRKGSLLGTNVGLINLAILYLILKLEMKNLFF